MSHKIVHVLIARFAIHLPIHLHAISAGQVFLSRLEIIHLVCGIPQKCHNWVQLHGETQSTHWSRVLVWLGVVPTPTQIGIVARPEGLTLIALGTFGILHGY
jgi:hypothetical protein